MRGESLAWCNPVEGIMSDQEFRPDDPEEMLRELMEIAKWDTICDLIDEHLPNDGDELAEICARGRASMKMDTEINLPVF